MMLILMMLMIWMLHWKKTISKLSDQDCQSNKKYYAVRATFPNRFFCDDDLEVLSMMVPNHEALVSTSLDESDIVWLMSENIDLNILKENLKILEKSLPTIVCETVEDCNWLDHVYEPLPPQKVGMFHICHKEEITATPTGMIRITIDSPRAFGAGTHPTTQGCLEILSDIKVKLETVLDIGTGSGILSIAMAKKWPNITGVATDVCEESVLSTQDNLSKNHVAQNIKAMKAEGLSHHIISDNAPYDLIVANILPPVLREIVPYIVSILPKNGLVVLSGIVDEQKNNILDIYKAHNFYLIEEVCIDGWNTLLVGYNKKVGKKKLTFFLRGRR